MTFQAGTPFTVDPNDAIVNGLGPELLDLWVTPDGGFEVVWAELSPAQTPGLDVTEFYRLYDSAGVPITDAINAGSWHQPLGVPVGPIHLVGTLPLADGTTLKEVSVSSRTTELQQFDQNGVALGPPVLTLGLGLSGMVQLPDGDVVLLNQGFLASPVFGRLLHNNGDTAPIAVDFFPTAGSTTLPPDWNIGITFSEPVKAGSGTITLATASGLAVQTFATASDPAVQFVGSSVVINPAVDLQPGTTYQLIVDPKAVQDLAGNAYAGLGLEAYTFTTAGAAPVPPLKPPIAIDFFPAAGSSTLPPDWNLGITFNEAVKAGTGTITLETAAGQVVQTFATASDPGIQIVGSSVIINPAADLQPGTTYTLVVAPDAVRNLSDIAYPGESGYEFTTADRTPPTVINFFPSAGSNSLPPNWDLGITFNETVKAGAGTITLETAAGQVVQVFATASDPGIQFAGPSIVINPAADLQPGTTYKLVVAPDAVQDLAGNAYAGESDYTFTTAALVGVPAV